MSQDRSGRDIVGRGVPGWRPAAALGLALALGACAASDPMEPMPDSLTIQRIKGQVAEIPPLTPVPGNVWPEQELERNAATMGDRDLLERAPTDNPPAPRRPIPRGSTTPPALLEQQGGIQPVPPLPNTAPSAPLRRAEEWERRTDGQVIHTPEGPAVTSGGGPGYRTYNMPGGGSGIAIPNGATTTLLGQDGTVRQVPTPR